MPFDIESMHPASGQMLYDNSEVRNILNEGQPSISMVHEHIHRGEYFEFTHVFEDVPAGAPVYVSFRPQTKEAHLLAAITSDAKIRFKSYLNTTWTANGTQGQAFNRKVGGNAVDTLVYYGGTPNDIGDIRFDIMNPGGSGPQSAGVISSEREESEIPPGVPVTLELVNDTAQVQDICVILGWYELPPES